MNIGRFTNHAKLDCDTARPNLRRDLHVFIAYIRDRKLKRGHRDNALSKTDARRLAKLLSDPKAEAEVQEYGGSTWTQYVDGLALSLGLVTYDTQGGYAGYTSHTLSYPDNYIEFEAKAYKNLTSGSLAQQERRLLDTLLKNAQGSESEFFTTPILGRLDCFSSRGSAAGIVPVLDFAAIRLSLFEVLSQCPIDEWLSVESLVEYLKKKNRYFLIPKNPKFKEKWQRVRQRYDNFYESNNRSDPQETIDENEPDAFERVEGRYVERFLEGIPNLLGYVDVAYAKRQPKKVYPSLGVLKAFRVSKRLRQALDGTIPEPTLRVTPSFDLYVQSELHPANVVRQLTPLCDLVSEDTTTVFRLDRQKVAAACAANSKLDVVRLLESLATEPLPANVRRELTDWSAHSEKFILYTGGALLESDGQFADLNKFCVENIAVGVDVVRSPTKLYNQLEKQHLAPVRIKHGERSLTALPPKTRSAFPRQTTAKRKRREPKTQVTLVRVSRIQLLCPDRKFWERMRQVLADANCPFEADPKRVMLEYAGQYEKQVSRAIRSLNKEFDVKINDQ